MILYAVVDKKAKALVSVFSSQSDESAKRSFLALITGPDNVFTQFPEDFALYSIVDLSINGLTITVCKPGSDVLASAGFTVDRFSLTESLDDGANYDKRYLAMVHQDRMSYDTPLGEVPEEDSENG